MPQIQKAYSAIRKGLAGVCLITSALGLTSCGHSYMTRVLVIIEVNENGKIITGSSVQKIGCRPPDPTYGGLDVGGCRIEGDAAYVRLHDGRYLFLTFGGKYHTDWEAYVNSILDRHDFTSDYEWDVPEDETPGFVTFQNMADPQTMTEVFPAAAEDNLGKGVSIGRIHVAMTDLPVRQGQIDMAIPWLKSFQQTYIGKYSLDRNAFTNRSKAYK